MNEVYCSLCGVEMRDNDTAYGLTQGSIDESCYGFKMDLDSDWDVYCTDCINEIDKLLATYRQSRMK